MKPSREALEAALTAKYKALNDPNCVGDHDTAAAILAAAYAVDVGPLVEALEAGRAEVATLHARLTEPYATNLGKWLAIAKAALSRVNKI